MTPALFDAGSGDLDRLAALHAACFPDGWTAAAITDLLATPNCYLFSTAEGFAMARAAADEAELLTLAVAPSVRRRGLGRALVTAAAIHAQTLGATAMFLEVVGDNQAARALYDRLGFVPVAARKGYYQGRDALILRSGLPLSPKANIA